MFRRSLVLGYMTSPSLQMFLVIDQTQESFGNATTVMNLNSSRFGKYNEMMFNPVGSLVGAGIKTFLLESSRVVFQQKGEKNYHVFYELLAGMEEEAAGRLTFLTTIPEKGLVLMAFVLGTVYTQLPAIEDEKLWFVPRCFLTHLL